KAFAERLLETWRAASAEYGREVPVIFTAHSVPSRTIAEGDPYEAQARQTAELVAKSAQLDTGWQFAFQSQGMLGGPWLGPTVESAILALKAAGHSGVFLQPIRIWAQAIISSGVERSDIIDEARNHRRRHRRPERGVEAGEGAASRHRSRVSPLRAFRSAWRHNPH